MDMPAFLNTRFQAIAHRGGADPAAGTENTLEAFRYAYDLGYRYLETDVHVTADGVPVIFHDAILSRVSDSVGAIADMPLEKLRQIHLGHGGSIPTVAELLSAFPDVAFNLDIKATGVAAPLARVLGKLRASDRVLVTSFSKQRLDSFRSIAGPTYTVGAPQSVVVGYVAHAKLGWKLPDYPAAALQVPVGKGPIKVVTPRFVAECHKAGRKVHVWTIDDEAEMNRLIDMGVDGIMTDRADILKKVLVQRGLWK
ncbi:MAG: glycerophosphodiester phosphodiesterase [Propionibacteriaceae bacterium]|jgi:glycerophosphoryl diester phosphodiesterase|nr:glycerophosphodiester phosphodiesterase [Propionibacteriaceae bacterium]